MQNFPKSGRSLSPLLALGMVLGAFSPATADDAGFDGTITPFLKKYCVACHGPGKQESRLRLDRETGITVGNRNLWTLVHQRVASGEMPPRTRPQPTAEERKRILADLALGQRKLGPAGARRLNRRELSAALRDVTGLEVDFSSGLPGDGTVGGFDTGADGLQEAADAVAQWLLVTRRAVEGIRFLEPGKGKAFSADLEGVKDTRKLFDAWKNDGATVRVPRGSATRGMLLEPRAVGEREEIAFSVPPRRDRQGLLRLTLVVSAMKPFPGIPNPRLWVRIGGKDLDYREITATPEKPERLVYQVLVGDLAVQAKGVTVSLSNRVEIPYAVEGFPNDDRSNPKDPPLGGTGLFRPKYERRGLPPEKQPAPFVVLHAIDIEPDVVHSWPPASWKVDLQVKDDAASAHRLLHLWMDRAYRRPVTEAEQEPFRKLYAELRKQGLPFDDALRAAFQSVLLSAPFRYMASPADADPKAAQYALASRLSFLLIGAPPDADLRKLAEAGKLRDSAVLDAQVDRFLDDPRSRDFLRPFVMQWLELEQPITIAQDHIQKQDFRFARYLKASMREETLAYVERLFAENRPAAELIVSDWTMMNDALARHYGYDGIDGGTFRKVQLRGDDPRGGGILGHAGIQSMLCWMGENWVIYRGAWTLRHILDHPPPPPPLEVPELNPSDGKNKGKPFRELLKQHQEDGRCAVCHRTIDPVGFAFQNFDLSGRWRKVEFESYARSELDGRIAWKGVGKTRPVDTVGNLPRGEGFRTFAEFKQRIVQDYREDLVRGLAKNLMIYATGRLPGIDDLAEIRTLQNDLRAKEYPLRDLLKAVVRSRAFTASPPSAPAIGRRPE